MAEEVKLGSVKRLGARYGTRIREKLGKIELLQKGQHKCPYCHTLKVKRLSTGIWYCNKCKTKFTGKAYFVENRLGIVIDEKKEEKKAEAEKKTAEYVAPIQEKTPSEVASEEKKTKS